MNALVIDKDTIQGVLSDFPKDVVIEDFIDQLIIAAKLDKALDQLDKGEYLTSEELDEEIKKWD